MRWRKTVPPILLLVLLGCTFAVWWFWSSTAAHREQDRFDQQLSKATEDILDRLGNYAALLRGGGALYAASTEVTRADWHAYYEYRSVRTQYPGILHVTFAPVLPRSQVPLLVQAVRKEGFPDYAVWPAGQDDTCAPVLYVEPRQAEGARRAMGFDLYTDLPSRKAMDRARDTGEVALSGKTMLFVQGSPEQGAGCVFYLPIYANGMPTGTLEERRQALCGFVLSPVRIGGLMDPLARQQDGMVFFQLYDGGEIRPDGLMYSTGEPARPLFHQARTLELFGHQWSLDFESTPQFEAGGDRWTAKGILGAGFLITFLTSLFVWSQEQTQKRAVALARQMTSAFRQGERRLRAVTESAQDAILVLDAQARLTYWNPAAERIFGHGREEVLGQEALPLIVAEPCRESLRQVLAETARDGECAGEGLVHDLTGLKKSGEEFPAEIAISTTSLADSWQTVMVVRDITERKRAEEERVAREAAEEASRAKSGFVANMSHEIRTPLNAILGFTQVLERDPGLTPAQAEHVRTISRSGLHLLNLINDILDMSRIEAGRVTVNKAPFCLHDLLDDLALWVQSRAAAKGLQLLEDRDESVPRTVKGDEGKIRQVFINLLGNAVKFTREGGVSVRVRAEDCPGHPEARRLVAEVEDSGPGIPEEDREKIFDAFGQSEAGIKAGGTGLGLAISKRFVEMMGGTMTVVSELGRGSRFRFELLVEPTEEVTEREKPVLRRVIGLEPGQGPFRILLVDDIQTNRALLVELLAPLGFELREAANGAEALEIFKSWSPHAVLMDMRMPVMDGYEATRRIRSAPERRDTPVIAVTASAFDDLKDQVMASGVDIYLRKPFRSDELLDALEKCTGVRYVYEGATAVRHAAMPLGGLASLPRHLISSMRLAIGEGDMARLAELIGQVPDGECSRSLQSIADRYEYERLLDILEDAEAHP